MIYLDHAATTKIRDEVFDAMLPYLKEEYGNPSSVYALGRSAHKALDRAREQVRAALGARAAREIFFTGCGTESDNWAIRGAALENAQKGRHIITTKVSITPFWIRANIWKSWDGRSHIWMWIPPGRSAPEMWRVRSARTPFSSA